MWQGGGDVSGLGDWWVVVGFSVICMRKITAQLSSRAARGKGVPRVPRYSVICLIQ